MVKTSSIVLIIITIIAWLIYLFPKEAIGPGDLLEKHSQLEEQCSKCHDTFLGPSGAKCVQCHTPEKIGAFNVNNQVIDEGKKQLSFHAKLTGDSCVSCHKEHQGSFTARQTIQFSHEMLGINDTNACVKCHQKPKDSIHEKVIDNCTQCHKTTSWASAEIDHNSYFKFDRDHQAACSTCHPNSNYKEYTCYGCHEHSPQKIERKHVKEGIHEYKNCAECHRSGDEHDIRKTRKVKSREVESREKKIKRHDKESKRSSDHSRESKRHSDDDHHEKNDHD
ncbi:class III cytochrome C family protein [bacterium]|nr:class III cytochrome C family protein [bacterium]